MILSEYDRRWAELCFYQFCSETYQMHKKPSDIIRYAEAICDLGEADKQSIKNSIQLMLNDTYYQATKEEIIMIGKIKGMSSVQLSKYLGMTRQGVQQYFHRNQPIYAPSPRCGIDEDYEMYKFLKTLDEIREIGSLGDGTINKS